MLIFVLGTRAEAIKLKPLISLADERKIPYKVVLTGQHDLSGFGFKNKVILFKRNASFFKSILSAFVFSLKVSFALLRVLKKSDILVVQGDTMAAASAAFAGWLKGCKVAHVESGLRTGNIFEPFPEEISRIIADAFSDYCFAPTYLAAQRTRNKKTYIVGNTVIDSLINLLKRENITVEDKDFMLITIHRQENIRNKKRLEKLVDQLLDFDIEKKFVMYPNTEFYLKKYGLYDKIKNSCEILPVLDYEDFIQVLAKAKYVISDSGGLAEECAYLGKPLHIFRKNTERIESVYAGIASLGLDLSAFEELLSRYHDHAKYLYGDGSASKRILKILMNHGFD